MKNRNVLAVLLLSIITLGIYGIYWQVSTKGEMNRLGAKIPTAWLLIVPIVNIWWMYKYSEGVEQVTGNKMSAIMAFILLFLIGMIGALFIQSEFNKVGASTDGNNPAQPPTAPPAQPQPPITPTTPTPVV